MSARQKITSLMTSLRVEPKKSLGQNFLVSDHVIKKIVDETLNSEPSILVEIGPGLGSLTSELAQKISNERFIILELDHFFANYWKSNGLKVFEVDALQWDWFHFLNENSELSPKVLVSNLPYQISSSLVIDRSLDINGFDKMVLMFQKEVAQRIAARKGHELYGMLSVMAQTFWNITNLLEAGPGDFLPAPKIASRVLVFKKKISPVKNHEQFLKFVKACFLHPRKMMISNLCHSLNREKEQLAVQFNEIKLSEKIRAQELSVEQYLELYFKLGYE